jgi:hypothetical protein
MAMPIFSALTSALSGLLVNYENPVEFVYLNTYVGISKRQHPGILRGQIYWKAV